MAGWKRGVFIALVVLTAAPLLAMGLNPLTSNQAAPASTEKEHVRGPDVPGIHSSPYMDVDRNKLFDTLDEQLLHAQPTTPLTVIASFDHPIDAAFAQQLATKYAATNYTSYPRISAVAFTILPASVHKLAEQPDVRQVEANLPIYPNSPQARKWFGVDKAVTDFGVNGDRNGNTKSFTSTDVVICIVDTGINANHVDLNENQVLAWWDWIGNQATPYDDSTDSHGTSVASLAAGQGDGNWQYRGVAYGAALAIVKSLPGNTQNGLDGINTCIDNKANYNIKVINISWGNHASCDGTDVLSQAVNSAFDNGIVVVTGPWNNGPASYTIDCPSAARDAITTCNMADVDSNGFFVHWKSGRGYTADGRVKPEICAPGYDVIGASATDNAGYLHQYGTSFASPFVAGTVALMLDANNSLSPASVWNKLNSTAQDWRTTGMDVDTGHGRLQAYDAVKSAGGYAGTGPTVPSHYYVTESIDSGPTGYDGWEFTTTTLSPIAVTMIEPGSNCFNLELYWYSGGIDWLKANDSPNPPGVCTYSRQLNVTYNPGQTGTWHIWVKSYGYFGTYYLDFSYYGAAPTLIHDEQFPQSCDTREPICAAQG